MRPDNERATKEPLMSSDVTSAGPRSSAQALNKKSFKIKSRGLNDPAPGNDTRVPFSSASAALIKQRTVELEKPGPDHQR